MGEVVSGQMGGQTDRRAPSSSTSPYALVIPYALVCLAGWWRVRGAAFCPNIPYSPRANFSKASRVWASSKLLSVFLAEVLSTGAPDF